MTKFDELKQRFPNVIPVEELKANCSIVDLALQHGYELQREKGKTRPVLKHTGYDDTIIIKNPDDASKQVYQRANDFTDRGTVIDFIKNRLPNVFSTFNRPGQNEFKNVLDVMYDYLRVDPNHIRENRKVAEKITDPGPKQPFSKEQFDLRPLEPNNYLNQRNIAPDILGGAEFKGRVSTQITYFDLARQQTEDFPTVKANPGYKYLELKNVAFPYYNSTSTDIAGLELRNEKIKLHAPGSDRFNSVFVSNTPPKTKDFFVMESAIDAISHKQLRVLNGDPAFNAVYFSTGGQLTSQQVNTISKFVNGYERESGFKLNLAFDNDAKGHRYDLQFVQQATASRFPLTPAVGDPKRATYILPEDPTYRGMRDSLLSRVEGYNQGVQAQHVRSSTDLLGNKEIGGQLIQIKQDGKQTLISIPENAAALSMVSKHVLELTGLDKHIQITKAITKDYNQDLTREVNVANRFRYAIKDETGQVLMNSNSPIQLARALQAMKHQGESEGLTKDYSITKRESFGYHKPQVDIKIVDGKTVHSTQKPDFDQALQMERKGLSTERTVGETRQPREAINPESKSAIGQIPETGLKPRQIKRGVGNE